MYFAKRSVSNEAPHSELKYRQCDKSAARSGLLHTSGGGDGEVWSNGGMMVAGGKPTKPKEKISLVALPLPQVPY
jgi:hypothetical protein